MASFVTSVQFIKGATGWAGLVEDGRPEVAFIGRSNVGKSSLINMVLGRKALARTSRTPGKTREINFYLVNERFYLVDVPGLGYAKVPRAQRNRWNRLIQAYLSERDELVLVFHLIDSRHPPTAIDKEVMQWMKSCQAHYIVALTKADKLSRNTRQKSINNTRKTLADYGLEVPIVLTSAEKKQGRGELWGWIRDLQVV